MENILSAEDDMTYSKTLKILLVIARSSIQHLCLPQTFSTYLDVLSHKNPSGRAACSTAWTLYMIFLALAPLKTGSLQANFGKSQKSLQSERYGSHSVGRQPSQCSVDLGHLCHIHKAASANQQMRTDALLLSFVTNSKFIGT